MTKTVPYRCEACIASGSYTGQLRHGDDPIPICRYHPKTEMSPVEVRKWPKRKESE